MPAGDRRAVRDRGDRRRRRGSRRAGRRQQRAAPAPRDVAPGAARAPSPAPRRPPQRPPPRPGRAVAKPFADVVKDAKEIDGPLQRSGRRTTRSGSRSRPTSSTSRSSSVEHQPGPRREPHLRRRDDVPDRRAQIVVFHKVGHDGPADRARTPSTRRRPGTPEARAVARGFSDSLLAVGAGRVAAASGAQVRADRGERAAARRHPGRGDACSSAPTASRTASTRATRRSARCARTPDNVTLDVVRALRAVAPRAAAAAAAPVAAAAAADHAARRAQPVPRLPLHLREAARRADAAARSPTSASATSRPSVFDFTTDVPRVPRQHYVEPLAAREEGSRRGAVGAEAADRVLARPQHPGQVPRADHATASSSGTRRSSGSATRTRSSVEMQPDDADFDTSDIRHASVRWHDRRATAFGAIGPSRGRPAHRRDPRRRHRHRREQRARRAQPALEYVPAQKDAFAACAQALADARSQATRMACTYDDAATEEAAFAPVAARGARRPRPRQPRGREVRRRRS